MLSGKQPYVDEQLVFFVFLTFAKACTASVLAVHALRKSCVMRVAASN